MHYFIEIKKHLEVFYEIFYLCRLIWNFYFYEGHRSAFCGQQHKDFREAETEIS